MKTTVLEKWKSFAIRMKAIGEKAKAAGLNEMSPEVREKCKEAVGNVLALKNTMHLILLQEQLHGISDDTRDIFNQVDQAIKEFEEATDRQIEQARLVICN